MKKVLNDWFGLEGDIYDDNGEIIDNYIIFANKVGIPQAHFINISTPALNEGQPLEMVIGGKRYSLKVIPNLLV